MSLNRVGRSPFQLLEDDDRAHAMRGEGRPRPPRRRPVGVPPDLLEQLACDIYMTTCYGFCAPRGGVDSGSFCDPVRGEAKCICHDGGEPTPGQDPPPWGWPSPIIVL